MHLSNNNMITLKNGNKETRRKYITNFPNGSVNKLDSKVQQACHHWTQKPIVVKLNYNTLHKLGKKNKETM